MALWYILYTKNDCPVCTTTRELLQVMGADYYEFNVEEDPSELRYLESLGLKSFPQVFFESRRIGGLKELEHHFGINKEDEHGTTQT